MSIHVLDFLVFVLVDNSLAIARVTNEFARDGEQTLGGIDVFRTPGIANRLTKFCKHVVRSVLYELVDGSDLQTVLQVPPGKRIKEENPLAIVRTGEHTLR